MTTERLIVFGSLVLTGAFLFSYCIMGLFDLRKKTLFRAFGDRLFAIALGTCGGLFVLYLSTTLLSNRLDEAIKEYQNEEAIQKGLEQSIRSCLFISDGKCFVSRYMLLKTENEKLQLCAKYLETQSDGTEVKKESCMDYNADRLPRR